MKIKPLADRVVIKLVEEEETTEGRPDPCPAPPRRTPQVAEVIAVGPAAMWMVRTLR